MASHLENRACKRARVAREELGLGLESRLEDVLAAVEQAGVAVAVLDLDGGVAGAYLRPGGTPIAFVNGVHAVQRMRFTLAHEFGHHRLGHGAVVDESLAMWDFSSQPEEVAANYFAAEFLMPKPAAIAWAEEHLDGPASLETVVRFAAEFGVSAKAACIRLDRAGVLGDRTLRARLHEEIDDGLHLEVTAQLDLAFLEDGIADAREHLPRLPAQLRASPLGELLVGALDLEEAARRSGRSAAELADALAATGLDRLVPALR